MHNGVWNSAGQKLQTPKVLQQLKPLKTIAKIIIGFIPLIALWIYLACAPMNYMDGEYSYYQQVKDLAYGKSGIRADVLVLGDSRAKSGIQPEMLSSCFNAAEGGSTAVESYFTLKNYIENVGVPSKVILSIGPYHFSSFDGFWTRSNYFDFFKYEEALEVIRTAESFGETYALKEAGGDGVFTLIEYKIKSPAKYMAPFVNSFGEDRKTINEEHYSEMVEKKGFKSFVSWWPTSYENDMDDWQLLKTLETYFRKTIELCRDNNIDLYVLNMPLIETAKESGANVTEPVSAFLETIKVEYEAESPGKIHIEADFQYYGEEFYDDADHLNPAGAEKYTAYMMKKYDIF